EKLDDYHNAEFQRFHLVKLLQTPPEGDGRYLCAARFLALSRFLGWPVNSLTTVTNHIHGRPHRYWRIGTGDGTKPRNRWQLMRDNGCVGIGWGDLGDLSQTKYDQDSKERIRAVIQGQYPNLTPSQVGKQTQQVFSFVARISERDLVLASDGATVLGVGRVIGKYYYEPTGYFRHRRPVKWLNLDEWKPPQPEGLMTVVHLLGKNVANLVETERRIMGTQPPIVRDHPEGVRLSGVMGRIHSILERKRQAVIYGPPGTGKTYWAMKTACELAAQTDFNMRFEDLDSEQKRSIIADDDVSSPTVRFCCFHPAYGYEDFIEGFRPRCSDGEMRFVLQPGILKRLCSDAVASPKRRFYLVIDEINRGDIPRIFGELMTILEKDKRGQSVTLPLSGSSFQVPDNVHVIGTMNTADRSISLLDTALRRRFGFIELMPDYSTLGSATVSGIPLGRWLKALNRRICDHVGRDARNRQIGHAYLLDGGEPVKELGKLANVLREDIIPLLEEYCYEDYSILEEILGSGLVDGKNQQIRRDVFDDAKQEELAQALLAIDPSLSTSSEALRSEAETPIEGEEVEGEDTEDSS
ncbi:MAG: AAA family ATPase, partial [Chloroflexota bacterium]|nr:AAA family ATPase [Chloroflexota bacterium]